VCGPCRDWRAELQAIGSLLESDNSKTGLISLKILNARFSFAVLQVLDLLTTLLAFHVGAFEVNPLIVHLIALFGRVGGVVLGKGIAPLAMGVRKRLWIVNLFYVGVICWNLFVLIALAIRRHQRVDSVDLLTSTRKAAAGCPSAPSKPQAGH
jgi:hypothetical protein